MGYFFSIFLTLYLQKFSEWLEFYRKISIVVKDGLSVRVCFCCFLSFWIMSGSQRPEDVALGHHVHGWATERHTYARTQNTHIQRKRKALQDKILYLYSLWPSVPWCLSVCVCLFDCFTVSLLIASDIYVHALFKALMLITCYLPRMSAVITVTQQYWVTRLQTRMSRPQPDPIRPHFLSIMQEPLWLAPVIDAECVRLLKVHRICRSCWQIKQTWHTFRRTFIKV